MQTTNKCISVQRPGQTSSPLQSSCIRDLKVGMATNFLNFNPGKVLLVFQCRPQVPCFTLLSSMPMANLIHPDAPAWLLRSCGSNLLMFFKFILSSMSGRDFCGSLPSISEISSLLSNPYCCDIEKFMSFCCIPFFFLPVFILYDVSYVESIRESAL